MSNDSSSVTTAVLKWDEQEQEKRGEDKEEKLSNGRWGEGKDGKRRGKMRKRNYLWRPFNEHFLPALPKPFTYMIPFNFTRLLIGSHFNRHLVYEELAFGRLWFLQSHLASEWQSQDLKHPTGLCWTPDSNANVFKVLLSKTTAPAFGVVPSSGERLSLHYILQASLENFYSFSGLFFSPIKWRWDMTCPSHGVVGNITRVTQT